MGAATYGAAAALRRTWRGAAALAVVVALVGGTVVACVAGARRTHDALPRFLDSSRPADFIVDASPDVVATLAGHPAVAEVDRTLLYAVAPVGLWEERFVPFAASLDGGALRDIERPIVLEGRLPDPSAPRELVLREDIAELLGVGAGDVVPFESLTDEGVAAIDASQGQDTGTGAGPTIDMQVVGVTRQPGDLAARASDQPFHHLTPAFDEEWQGRIGTFGGGGLVRLNPGRDISDLSEAVARLDGEAYVEGWPGSAAAVNERLEPTVETLRNAILAFAAVLALAGAVALAQALQRSMLSRGPEAALLASLGASRRSRVLVLAGPAVVVGTIAVPGVVVVAVLMSGLFPLGVARRAELSPGIDVDGLVLVPGVISVGALVAGLAWLVAARIDRQSSGPGAASARSDLTSTGRWVARLAPSSAAATVGGSLLPRAGASLSPRLGSLIGTAGIVAAVVFGASLTALVDDPRLYGWTWDIGVDGTENDPVRLRAGVDPASDPAVAEVSTYVGGLMAEAGGHPVFLHAMGEGPPGGIAPVVSSGRPPVSGQEIAVGPATLDEIDRSVGDELTLRSSGGSATYRIVGEAVVPVNGDGYGRITDGVSMTLDGLRQLGTEPTTACEGDDDVCTRQTVLRFADESDSAAAIVRLVEGGDLSFATPTPPGEVQRLAEIEAAPHLLAASLALLAAAAVGHSVVIAVRRRSHDLGIARSLGLTRSQAGASVLVLAISFVGAGTLLGTLLGVVGGRSLWRAVALDIGARPEPAVPWVVGGVPLAVLLVAALLAAVPAWRAGRLRPFEILRAE
jgi:FtsX-like permease family